MKKEFQDIISSMLGVEPILINSALVSAQNRKRLYWTNIEIIGPIQPEDKGIMLKDIVHENVDFKLIHSEVACDYLKRAEMNLWFIQKESNEKAACVTANYHKGIPYNAMFTALQKYIVPFDDTLKILEKEIEKGKIGYFRKDSQANRIYYIHDKAVTLCGDAGGGAAKMGQYLFGSLVLTKEQVERGFRQADGKVWKTGNRMGKMDFPNNLNKKAKTLTMVTTSGGRETNHVFGVIIPDRLNKRQNGQRFSEGQKFYTLTAQDRHGILIEGYIRKLTPIECERLQTVPDNHTDGVSDSQRYKMLGNGWTVDVISHIFENLIFV